MQAAIVICRMVVGRVDVPSEICGNERPHFVVKTVQMDTNAMLAEAQTDGHNVLCHGTVRYGRRGEANSESFPTFEPTVLFCPVDRSPNPLSLPASQTSWSLGAPRSKTISPCRT